MVVKYKWAIFLAVCSVLSACGGSSSGDPDVKRTRPSVDYSDYEDQSQALHDTWDAISFTDPSTLPMSGSASYSGVIQLDVERGPDEISMAGELNLNVSFADDKISGRAKNFVDETNTAYEGNLTLSNGSMDRSVDPATDYTYEADLSGTLRGGGERFDIAADLAGDFRGSNWGGASGAIQGRAKSSFGMGYIFGEFIAAR